MSNGNVRKLIREYVASVVDDAFDLGKVHACRVVDARDFKAYGNVFFSDGEAEYEGLQRIHTAELAIGIHLDAGEYSDNDLDDCGDRLEGLLDAQPRLQLDAVIAGMIYSGFEYGESDESPFISLYLKYTIQY